MHIYTSIYRQVLAGNGNGQLPVHIIAIGAAHTALIEIPLDAAMTATAKWTRNGHCQGNFEVDIHLPLK